MADLTLKPCPFCGAAPKHHRVAKDSPSEPQMYGVFCLNRDCEVKPAIYGDDLELRWNRRSPVVLEATLRERIEADLMRANEGRFSPLGADEYRNWRVAYADDVAALLALLPDTTKEG